VVPGFVYQDPNDPRNKVAGEISSLNPEGGFSDLEVADEFASSLYGKQGKQDGREYAWTIEDKNGSYFFTNPYVGYKEDAKVEWNGKTVSAGGRVTFAYSPKTSVRIGHSHPDSGNKFSDNDIRAVITRRGAVKVKFGISFVTDDGKYRVFNPSEKNRGQLRRIYKRAVTNGKGLEVKPRKDLF